MRRQRKKMHQRPALSDIKRRQVTNKFNVSKLRGECQDFLNTHPTVPLIKWVPNDAVDDCIKIKLRYKKHSTDFDRFFNNALSHDNLRQQCIFIENDEKKDHSPFIIIPPNGYKYVYSTLIDRSETLNETLLKPLLNLKCEKTIETLFKEVLTSHYTDVNLEEALLNDREIILYNVSHVYGFAATVFDFDQLVSFLNEDDVQ